MKSLTRTTTDVLGIGIDVLTMESALDKVRSALDGDSKGYVCVTGVHGVMESQRNPLLAEAYACSLMNVPDGMPLAWVGRIQGHPIMERVTGPDLMWEIFRDRRFRNTTHVLFGGNEGVADELKARLKKQFPRTKILGTFTPPFREMTSEERSEFVQTIAKLNPDIIWVGISCPKQEVLMASLLPLLETRLMFGVGAAFDYHTGRIRDCAPWIKRAGLQWLHRLAQDPRRLWKRYLRNNPAFLFQISLQLLRFKKRNLFKRPQKTDITGGRLTTLR